MKALLLFVLFPVVCFGQAYVPLVDTTIHKQWKDYIYCAASLTAYGVKESIYTWNGDTIINGETYIAMSQLRYTKGFNGFPWWPTAVHFFPSNKLIREDDKRVYEYRPTSGGETVIYDFNLSVGDTVPDPEGGTYSSNGDHVIIEIDSIFINQAFRTRFTLAGSHSIIEGIGSTSGLFQTILGTTLECGNRWLECYIENDTAYYAKPAWLGTSCATNLSVYQMSHINFQISPNPVQSGESFVVHSDYQIEQISILNTQSQVIKTVIAEGKEQSVDVSFPSGVYFAIIQTELGNTTKRLIVH